MALILNLETATTVCSVALARDGQLLAAKEQHGDYSHAENLTLFIEDVLKQAQLSLPEVDAIAVSKGPGSYTGLRIGVSTAKGLCYSLNKPLIAVDTLQHLALSGTAVISNTAADALYCPMIDARRMEVYCGVYDGHNREIKPVAAEIIDEQSFSALLKNHTLYFFGDGAAKCQAVLGSSPKAVFADVLISAKSMVPLAEKAFAEKRFENTAYFEPFYLKDFVAGKKSSE